MTDDLINTLEASGEFDALTRLRPGEPYFALVGRDRLAPPLIREWADRNRRRALAESDDGKITDDQRDHELRKSTQAEMAAATMVEYKNGWDTTREQERQITTYSGHELPEATQRRDAIQSARARARSAVSGAVSDLTELCALLDENDAEQADQANVLRETIADLKALADEIAPRRVIWQAPAPLLDSTEERDNGNEA